MQKFNYLLFYYAILISNFVLSQKLVVNEVSQGPSGIKEYVELLVIPGTTSYQCDNYCMDLRGWILDDNNGYFSGGPASGVGIANGAVRFKNDSFWQCIPIGTLILIYNDLEINTAIPANDLSTTDGNCRFVIPISSALFEHQTVSPTTSSIVYPSTGWLSGGLWGPISMANGSFSGGIFTGGDSFQIFSSSDYSVPVHGVSWANNNVNTIIYFSAIATNSVYYFGNTIDNNPSNQANWISGTCSAPDNQTPGSPNNAANSAFISSLTNNCAGPLSATLSASVDAGSCQCNGSATVSASGSIPTYTYAWYNSSNVSINQSTPTATNLCAGSYYCVVSSSISCTDTVLVLINSTSNTITPTFNAILPICVGGTINLPSTSTNGITGSWSPAVNTTATTTYTFTPDPNQCASATTLTVQVSNSNTSTFDPIAPICAGGTINLATTSTNGISGSWSPAVNNTTTTTYTFTPDPNQCANSTSLTVQVNPIPDITINENPVICPGENSVLTSTTTTPGGTYIWTPGGETSDQISVSPSVTTNYTLLYTYNGCSSNVASATVKVQSTNSPIFDSFGPFCQDAILPQVLLPETSNNGITGTWNPQMLSTEVSGDISYTFNPNQGQCASPFTLIVKVYPAPPIDAGTDVLVCSGSSIKLTASGGANYIWTGGIQNGQSFIPVKTEKYFVIGQGANGCESSDSVTITLVTNPNAKFTAEPTIGTAPLNVSFSNLSLNAIDYNWLFGDGTTSIQENASHTYFNSGEYMVRLIASNGFCKDSVSQIIQVLEPNKPLISFPNVFTPNGDGANDEWFVTTENISELQVIILNRWGNQVAKLETINDSWNGNTNEGEELTDGSYFYKYQAKAMNGQELVGQGFFTLMR